MRSMVVLWLLLGGCTAKPAGRDAASVQRRASTSDGGLPFGATCTLDADCATGHCFPGTRHFCTMPCTPATAHLDCPSPPSAGTCNKLGFCRP